MTGIGHLSCGARNVNHAALQRFSQHFQHSPIKFRQFIEKKYAVMGERNFPGPRITATAHQSHRTGSVMRRTHLPLAKRLRFEFSNQRQNGGALGRLVFCHGRQDSG